MKLLVITNYLGNKGGLGRYSTEVVKALRKKGLDLTVVTEIKNGDTSTDNAILRPVFNCSKIQTIINIIYNIFIFRFKSNRYDIIHAHDGWPYGLYGYFAVLGTRKKLFITGIGTYTVTPLRKRWISYLMKLVYNRAARIFCISNYVKREIDSILPGLKTSVVHMGTTKLKELDNSKIHEYKKMYDLISKKHDPIFLTVGDIKKRKGQLDTIKSINLIKKDYPNFLYVMIGNGDDTYYIDQINDFAYKNNLENNILIISNIYDDMILSFFYSICDIFMLNSNNEAGHFEGFGLVLLEAAQFGKPVIGSSGCGIEDAIIDGYNGFLSIQGDHYNISRNILYILKGDRNKFILNSKEFYRRFSWESTVNRYYDNYIE